MKREHADRKSLSDQSPAVLLRTKLFVPQSQHALVQRSHLTRKLALGQTRKLTLVCAPAGFGKTTLLSTWVSQSKQATAWLSLDQGDNDPTRFLVHLIAALQTLEPELGDAVSSLFQAPQPPQPESVLTHLINDVTGKSLSFCLVLDDYHLISNQTIHEAMAFLLEHLPPTRHLAIASRRDPPLPLARLRAQHELFEVRASDLRFTELEAETYLNDVMDLALSAEDINALQTRTEGWVVGLQLAAMSLQEHQNRPAFIQTFAGDNRYVLDYLLDEVFSRQTAHVQEFLLTTSFLGRLCAPLCDVVMAEAWTGGTQTMLETLEQANLFIIPLDDKREWYRYHHLFADLLQNRLKRLGGEHLQELHRRAGRWFEASDLADEALYHYLAAGDAAQAAALIERLGEATLWRRGEVARLTGWLEQLPKGMVERRPRLMLLSAWTKHLSGDIDAVFSLVEQIEGLLQDIDPTTETRRSLGEAATLRAYAARMQGELERSLELYQQALSLSDLSKPYVLDGMAEVHFLKGDLAAAAALFSEALELLQTRGEVMPMAFCMWRLTEIYSLQGQLRKAWETCQTMLHLNERDVFDPRKLGYAQAQLGRLSYERNDLEGANTFLSESIERGKQLANPRVYVPALIYLAQTWLASGDIEKARTLLQEAEEVTAHHHINWTWGLPSPDVYKLRLQLNPGETGAPFHWAEGYSLKLESDLAFKVEAAQIMLARVLLAQNNIDAAFELLHRLEAAALDGERWGRLLEIKLLKALACEARGESKAALNLLAEVLTHAEPEGYVRLFVDEGVPLRKLLEQARASTNLPTYVDKLLSAFGATSPHPQPASDALLEPLSERELSVLRLLAGRLSDKEIAKELNLAVNTIKWYDRNIYSKLGVGTRKQAITKAKELNIL